MECGMKEANKHRSGPHSNRWGRKTMERRGWVTKLPVCFSLLECYFYF